MATDEQLTPDGEAPYDDWADLYDKVYAYLDYDIGFYRSQAEASGGPVLELGCGTGRVALALADAGFDVTGVDISPRMIAQANAKAAGLGLTSKASFVVGDMADADPANVRAEGTFGLVCFPFRSFQSMLAVEDQREALQAAAAQLREGGLLALDTFAPDMEQLGDRRDEAIPFHIRDVDQPDGGNIVVWGQNLWDGVSQVNSARLIVEELDSNGLSVARHFRDFDLRYTFRYEMEHLLELSGFTLEAVYGDFEGGEVTDQSDDLVWIAHKTN
jgi:SAM-dependent methyltransferase